MTKLTKREQEVYELILTGVTNSAVGAQLNVKEKTIKYHLTSIYKKLNVKTKAELIAKQYEAFKSPVQLALEDFSSAFSN